MKNNIDYYQHFAGADQHPKFKMLRNEYGWEGEGKFWALNNRIAQSEDCFLDISKKYNKASLANDLNFKMEELDEFILFLIEDCELITATEKGLTTDMIQENFLKVSKKRKKDNFGYQKDTHKDVENLPEMEVKNEVSETLAEDHGKEAEMAEKPIQQTKTEIPLMETDIPLMENTQSKVKESKGKESKGNERKGKRSKAPPEAVLFTLHDLNKRLGLKRGFSAFSEKNQSLILARMKEGFTLADLITVNEKKCRSWLTDPDMCKYLRPETLYGSKFEGYLIEIVASDQETVNFQQKKRDIYRKPSSKDRLATAWAEMGVDPKRDTLVKSSGEREYADSTGIGQIANVTGVNLS